MGCTSSTSLPKSGDAGFSFAQEYELGEELSSGSYGKVYACHRRDSASPSPVAVKVIDLRAQRDDDDDVSFKPINAIDENRLQNVCEEVSVWRAIAGENGNSNCVDLISSGMEHQTFYMVMERCSRSLKEWTDELQGEAFPDLSGTLRQMLSAIAHVHDMGVIHRDVKPGNFLQSWDRSTVKLCDFGLSTRMPKGGLLKDLRGTGAYMSPEMLGGKGYAQKTDVWSLGVSAYLLAFGVLPYRPIYDDGFKALKAIILSGKPEPSYTGGNIDRLLRDLVRALLTRAPESRCSAENALQLLPRGATQPALFEEDCDKHARERQVSACSTCEGETFVDGELSRQVSPFSAFSDGGYIEDDLLSP